MNKLFEKNVEKGFSGNFLVEANYIYDNSEDVFHTNIKDMRLVRLDLVLKIQKKSLNGKIKYSKIRRLKNNDYNIKPEKVADILSAYSIISKSLKLERNPLLDKTFISLPLSMENKRAIKEIKENFLEKNGKYHVQVGNIFNSNNMRVVKLAKNFLGKPATQEDLKMLMERIENLLFSPKTKIDASELKFVSAMTKQIISKQKFNALHMLGKNNYLEFIKQQEEAKIISQMKKEKFVDAVSLKPIRNYVKQIKAEREL